MYKRICKDGESCTEGAPPPTQARTAGTAPGTASAPAIQAPAATTAAQSKRLQSACWAANAMTLVISWLSRLAMEFGEATARPAASTETVMVEKRILTDL